MKSKIRKNLFFFVDESGDPFFYDRYGQFIVGKEGCSKTLIIGAIKTECPDELRASILKLRDEIKTDEYLKDIPSIAKTIKAFHATDDIPEVREKVYKTIRSMKFKAEFIVARKNEEIFKTRHKSSSNVFYDDILSCLFETQLHVSEENVIYYAVRANQARQKPFEEAIRTAVVSFETRHQVRVNSNIQIYPQRPEGEPCLQIIDYMNWAVQRAFVRREMRYLDYVKSRISLIADIYDTSKQPRNCYYSVKNPITIEKISPL